MVNRNSQPKRRGLSTFSIDELALQDSIDRAEKEHQYLALKLQTLNTSIQVLGYERSQLEAILKIHENWKELSGLWSKSPFQHPCSHHERQVFSDAKVAETEARLIQLIEREKRTTKKIEKLDRSIVLLEDNLARMNSLIGYNFSFFDLLYDAS